MNMDISKIRSKSRRRDKMEKSSDRREVERAGERVERNLPCKRTTPMNGLFSMFISQYYNT